ncbi:IclR family transcriptional regulator (plasmid) [Paraburkholderia terrae]|uniref:IclR family transcriptional regulator n=1 Tax=Paraburkholderia terrae TaxID=311230 RepID=A0ABM7U374_9BURK|nr:IclR family transcriptional regulator [Paraburkholderia terrae]BCZ85441.1 IclR family transcriptional regulator [Paraburkholderia terrae]
MLDLSENKSEAGGTQSIGRATALLRVLAAAGPAGMGLGEVAARAQMERPTVHRILRRLINEAMVIQAPSSRAYHLGPLLYELGLAAAPSIPAQELCTAALKELSMITGDSSFLMVRSGTDSVCLQRQEGHFPIKVLVLAVGQRRPLGCGAGSIALMSLLPDEQVDNLLRVNRARLDAHGEPDTQTLRAIIRKARDDGFATKDAPDLPVRSLSMPVRDAFGNGLCALSVTSLTMRIEQRQSTLVSSLRQLTQELSRKIPGTFKGMASDA